MLKEYLSFSEALKLKPEILVMSKKIESKDLIDGYLNYEILNPPKGYKYDSYELRHITMDNIQLVFYFKRAKKLLEKVEK